MFYEGNFHAPETGQHLVPGLLSTAALFSPDEVEDLLKGYPATARKKAHGCWILAGDVGPKMWSRLRDKNEPVQFEMALTPSLDDRRLLAISNYMSGVMHRFVLAVDDARTQAFLRDSLSHGMLFSLGQAGGDMALLVRGEVLPGFVRELIANNQTPSGTRFSPSPMNKGVLRHELFVAPSKHPQLQEISISIPEELIFSYQSPVH